MAVVFFSVPNNDENSTVVFQRKPAVVFMAGLLSLLCGAGIFGKIWSACWQNEIQYTDEE
jgi:hypothetical protein